MSVGPVAKMTHGIEVEGGRGEVRGWSVMISTTVCDLRGKEKKIPASQDWREREPHKKKNGSRTGIGKPREEMPEKVQKGGFPIPRTTTRGKDRDAWRDEHGKKEAAFIKYHARNRSGAVPTKGGRFL